MIAPTLADSETARTVGRYRLHNLVVGPGRISTSTRREPTTATASWVGAEAEASLLRSVTCRA
jgi:hypothetical protein